VNVHTLVMAYKVAGEGITPRRVYITLYSIGRIINENPGSLNVVKLLCLKIQMILFGDSIRLVLRTPIKEPVRFYKPTIV
jgi:hypothetical protein